MDGSFLEGGRWGGSKDSTTAGLVAISARRAAGAVYTTEMAGRAKTRADVRAAGEQRHQAQKRHRADQSPRAHARIVPAKPCNGRLLSTRGSPGRRERDEGVGT